MEERLAAMQRQIDATAAQNRLLALRLRQVAAAYRVAAALGGAGLGGVSGGGPTVAGAAVARRHAGPGGAVDEAAVGQGRIPLSQVAFAGRGVWPGGRAAIRGYLAEALSRMGITDARARGHWIAGMMTIADHESGFRADAINLSDSNALGARQVDGGPLHATRGPWQVMPDTFAAFHQPGTSNSVWDPVAAACASMNYQMSRYGVSRDGDNERALVGQANPGIRQCY
jgi:hypothetical protein